MLAGVGGWPASGLLHCVCPDTLLPTRMTHPTRSSTDKADNAAEPASANRPESAEPDNTRCPKCGHWFVTHGVPTEDDYACTAIMSTATERWEMSKRDAELRRQGVPPEVAGPRGYRDLRFCDCTFAEGNPVVARQVRSWHDGDRETPRREQAAAGVVEGAWH